MADCNNTKVFCSEIKRMCYYYHAKTPDNPCFDCPIKYDGCDITTRGLLSNGLIEKVQMWSDLHPVKNPKTQAEELFAAMFTVD